MRQNGGDGALHCDDAEDFEWDEEPEEQLVWSAATAYRNGYVWLLDSGTFGHMWGTASRGQVYDIQKADPITVNGATGMMVLEQTGMLMMPNGLAARGYINPNMELNLICEDQAVEDWGWKITHRRVNGMGCKTYDTDTARFTGAKVGHLFFMPSEPGSYQFACPVIKSSDGKDDMAATLREHKKGFHKTKCANCPDCEYGYMQAHGQRKGATAKYLDNVLGMDTIDHGHEDNNGHRYTVNGAILRTYAGDVVNNKNKDSTTTGNSYREIKHYLESNSTPGINGNNGFRVNMVCTDKGSEFDGRCGELMKEDNVMFKKVETGRHVGSIEALNKRLEVMAAATGQTACDGNSQHLQMLHGELYLAARAHLNNSSITTYQKERDITAWKEQTGRDHPFADANDIYVAGELVLCFLRKDLRAFKVTGHAVPGIYMSKSVKDDGHRVVPFSKHQGMLKLHPTIVCKQVKVYPDVFPLHGDICDPEPEEGFPLVTDENLLEDIIQDVIAYEPVKDAGKNWKGEGEVERILNHTEQDETDGSREYQVKWKGWPSEHNQWKEENELEESCKRMLQNYQRRHQLAARDIMTSAAAFSTREQRMMVTVQSNGERTARMSNDVGLCAAAEVQGHSSRSKIEITEVDTKVHHKDTVGEGQRSLMAASKVNTLVTSQRPDNEHKCESGSELTNSPNSNNSFNSSLSLTDSLTTDEDSLGSIHFEAAVETSREKHAENDVNSGGQIPPNSDTMQIPPNSDTMGASIDHATMEREVREMTNDTGLLHDTTVKELLGGICDTHDVVVSCAGTAVIKQWTSSEIRAMAATDIPELMHCGGAELELKEAMSTKFYERTKAAFIKEIVGMENRRFRYPEEGELTEEMKQRAQKSRMVFVIKRPSPEQREQGMTDDDATIKARLVIQDFRWQRPVSKEDSYAATPGLDHWRTMISTFRPDEGEVMATQDAQQAFLQLPDFEDGLWMLIRFFDVMTKQWQYVYMSGPGYGMQPCSAWWRLHYQFVLVHRIGFYESANAPSTYYLKGVVEDGNIRVLGEGEYDALGSILVTLCCHVDDPCFIARCIVVMRWFDDETKKSGIETNGLHMLAIGSPFDYMSQRVSLDTGMVLRIDNADKVLKFLKDAGMEDCRPESIPFHKEVLSRVHQQQVQGMDCTDEDRSFVDRGIGQLNWLVSTTHVVGAVAHSFLAGMRGDRCVPAVVDAIKHMYRWMKGARWRCLELRPGNKSGLVVSTDSDWGGTYFLNGDVLSRSGILVENNGFVVKAVSEKQKMTGTHYEEEPKMLSMSADMEDGYVALSSCEGELVAAHTGTQLGLHYQYCLDEYGQSMDGPLQVNVDAAALIAFSLNLGVGRMKHLDMRRKWVCLVRDWRMVKFIKISTKHNKADFFSKVFGATAYKEAQDRLNPELPEDLVKLFSK